MPRSIFQLFRHFLRRFCQKRVIFFALLSNFCTFYPSFLGESGGIAMGFSRTLRKVTSKSVLSPVFDTRFFSCGLAFPQTGKPVWRPRLEPPSATQKFTKNELAVYAETTLVTPPKNHFLAGFTSRTPPKNTPSV